MTPDYAEATVRKHHPNAELQRHEAVYETGQKAPVQPEHWAVYPQLALGVQPLGTGSTAAAAWEAAAAKVAAG